MEDPRGWIFVMIIWAIIGFGPFVIGGIICIVVLISESKKRRGNASNKEDNEQ